MKSRKPARPKSQRRNLRHLVDQDYIAQLSPEEREWLAAFHDCHYAGKYSNALGEHWDDEARRATYSAHQRTMLDAMVVNDLSLEPFDTGRDVSASEFDTSDAPPYLGHPRYKAALQAWRDEPDRPKGMGMNATGVQVLFAKVASPRKRKLYDELQQIIRLGQAGLLDD